MMLSSKIWQGLSMVHSRMIAAPSSMYFCKASRSCWMAASRSSWVSIGRLKRSDTRTLRSAACPCR